MEVTVTLAFWTSLMLVVVVFYILPTVVALIRQVDKWALVLVCNLLGGATGVGWLAALILSVSLSSRRVTSWTAPIIGYMPGQMAPPDDAYLAAIVRKGDNPAHHWRD
ncbi:superinfection immunity protein [Actinomadura sp. NPDC048955]|uniref:superinfection immunity protein n=1 Tax=Actinomadura sp. NPDC048955 TaxID=3158228 RepID=UPI0033EC7B43